MSSILTNIVRPFESFKNWLNSPSKRQLIYRLSEGGFGDESILSRKGVGLCEISRLGLCVPPTFILSSDASLEYRNQWPETKLPETLVKDLRVRINELEIATGRKFGSVSGPLPLLLSVRVGSLISPSTLVAYEDSDNNSTNKNIIDLLGVPDSWSIPGVKDSCLGLGMNDEIVEHLANTTSSRFAYNTYAHFILRFGTLVLGVPRLRYHQILSDFVNKTGRSGNELTIEDLKLITEKFKEVQAIPTDPFEQLEFAIREMYCYWFSKTAIDYRSIALDISDEVGVAIIVQVMVFGTVGICFSRNPITGSNSLFGSIWPALSGQRVALNEYDVDDPALLTETAHKFEKHFKDMIQFEFVCEESSQTMFVLQANLGRRTVKASVKIAVDMINETLLTEREGLMKIDAKKVGDFYTREQISQHEQSHIQGFGTGVPCSQGVVTGIIVFSSVKCVDLSSKGEKVILCLNEFKSSDARAIKAAAGVVSIKGGVSSPVAVLCRGLGKPCLDNVLDMKLIDAMDGSQDKSLESKRGGIGGTISRGTLVTLDGGNGILYIGSMPTVSYINDVSFQQLIAYSDKFRKLRVNSNINPMHSYNLSREVELSSIMGSDGLGVINTDNIFLRNTDALAMIRQILVKKTREEKLSNDDTTLSLLEDLYRNELISIFRNSHQKGKLQIKLLDISLSSFFPQLEEEKNIVALAAHLNLSVAELKETITILHDTNPDMGLKGCRISAYCSEITDMQVRSILGACLNLLKSDGTLDSPCILVPDVASSHEMETMLSLIHVVAANVLTEYQRKESIYAIINPNYYSVGLIVNNPRACLRMETIAPLVPAVIFNTSDLTANVFGAGRRDSEKYFPIYKFDKIYLADPFVSIDDLAVGSLIKTAIKKCRDSHPGMEISIGEGEHTGDPRSIAIFNEMGLDCVMCSPSDVPTAKISAAQSEISQSKMMEFAYEEDLMPVYF